MATYLTIDNRYEHLAEMAASQCEALVEKFQEVTDPDDIGEPERLQGITKTPTPIDRPALVFQSSDTPNQRSMVFVDAILDLAALIQRERIIPYKPKRD